MEKERLLKEQAQSKNEEERIASKEEINSIVNRLYYNRLTSKNNRTLQDVQRDGHSYDNERNGMHNETITSVVDINFEGNDHNTLSNNSIKGGTGG